jgi:hypothetical protein
MLTWEEDVEVSALHHRGWTISVMARHLGRSRNTIRAYLRGERRPGERRPSTPDPLAPYLTYVTERLREDPHVWATALWDEVRRLGYAGAYSSCGPTARPAPRSGAGRQLRSAIPPARRSSGTSWSCRPRGVAWPTC